MADAALAARGLGAAARAHHGRGRTALPGITPERTFQIVAGGVVAVETMRALGVDEVEICPWALREGAILRRLDHA